MLPDIEVYKKFKRSKFITEPTIGFLGFSIITFGILCSLFYLDYKAVGVGYRFKHSEQNGRFGVLRINGSVQNSSKVEFLDFEGSGCDLFNGDWIWDDTYPLYQSKDCSFMDSGFRCIENGRRDLYYTKWRWQPKNCNLPRYKDLIFMLKF